jgi:drug/metabolite transporter (DMT)-like permease
MTARGFVAVRALSPTEITLLTAIVLWALNFTMTRYVLTHGFQPLAYVTVRYGLAAAIFLGLSLWWERSLRIAGRDRLLVLAAIATLSLNQLAFVYSLKTTPASLIALVNASTPAFVAVIGLLLRIEILTGRFWAGSAASFAGVALVAWESGGGFGGDLGGVLLGVVTAITWAVYSLLITPLMRSYSPARISAVVLGGTWALIALAGVGQTSAQDFGLGWEVWAVILASTLGPLVATNFLWFRALARIGPARATLALNLQPFMAALLAVALLGEALSALQVAGGALIAAGILVARGRPVSPPAE